MTQQVQLIGIDDPVSHYGRTNPQRVALDTGTSIHFIINSKKATKIPINPYNFTVEMTRLAGTTFTRISPAAISAHLLVNNINKYNNTFVFQPSTSPTAITITLTIGCYSPDAFAAMLQTAMNDILVILGVAGTFTATYDGTTETMLLEINAPNTFRTFTCSLLTNGAMLFQAPNNGDAMTTAKLYTDMTMVYTRYIHISASRLTLNTRMISNSGDRDVFASIEWGEPWIKNKSFSAGSAFTSSHFIADGTLHLSSTEVLLLDDYNTPLTDYCTITTATDFTMIIALSR